MEQEIAAFVEALGNRQEAEWGHLFSAAYGELRNVARAQRRRSGVCTLCTTEVVHEVYLKLSRQQGLEYRDRAHFFRIAARAMRFILIDYAERGRAAKRGGADEHVPADSALLIDESRVEEVLALDEALTRLARNRPRWARIVECRAFAGLDVEETAEALDVSTRTVERDWRRAQAWLYCELVAR